jgi:adenylyltransferase/sulfurtransferase
MQAAEALKLLLGLGEPLLGRMKIMDVLQGTSRVVRIQSDPACPACGTHRTMTDFEDRTWSCSADSGKPAGASVQEIDAMGFLEILRDNPGRNSPGIFLLDVRRPDETSLGIVPGARMIPLLELARDLTSVVQEAGSRTVVIYCQRGARSLNAGTLLAPKVPGPVYSLRGGYESYLGVRERAGAADVVSDR